MNANDSLIPRAYVRFGIAAGVVLAVIAGVIFVGNYALTVLQQRHRDMAIAGVRAQVEANQRAAAQRVRWLDAKVLVSLKNRSDAPVSLWTATPNGTHPDGSAIWSFNAACTAYSGETCMSQIYNHRGILITAHSGPYSNDATWHWRAVPAGGLALTAHNVSPNASPSPTASPTP